MPLRLEVRSCYGRAWRKFRAELLSAAIPQCEQCGAVREHGMNLAHLTHDPMRRDRLAWMCPSCHARHDTPQRVAMTRRTRARRAGQLWLLPEIEFAPFPIWEVPAEVLIEARQERIR